MRKYKWSQNPMKQTLNVLNSSHKFVSDFTNRHKPRLVSKTSFWDNRVQSLDVLPTLITSRFEGNHSNYLYTNFKHKFYHFIICKILFAIWIYYFIIWNETQKAFQKLFLFSQNRGFVPVRKSRVSCAWFLASETTVCAGS